MLINKVLRLLRTTLALVLCCDGFVEVVQRRQLFLLYKIELKEQRHFVITPQTTG